MAMTLAPPVLDREALVRVSEAALPLRGVAPDEAAVDLIAQLHMALDQEALAGLRFLAAKLLALEIPQYEYRAPFIKKLLLPILDAVSNLETALDVEARRITKLTGSTVNPLVRESAQVVLQALEAVYEQLESIRWAVMSAEAQAELESGQGTSFDDAEAATAYLRRIQ